MLLEANTSGKMRWIFRFIVLIFAVVLLIVGLLDASTDACWFGCMNVNRGIDKLPLGVNIPIPSKYADDKGKFDELVEDKGVKILIDPKALMHVIGTKMDFVDDKLKSEFIFINPNSQGQCGCGESFMTTSSAGATKRGGA